MLTHLRPEIHRIEGTRINDAFEVPGEPIGVRHLCEGGIKALFGILPEELVSRRVKLTAEFVDY